MKKNIAILGYDIKLCEAVAERLATDAGMFYLALDELCCYHACRKSISAIFEGDGEAGVFNFYNKALSDFFEYENTTASGNVKYIEKERLAKLLPTTLVLFLGKSGKALKADGIEASGVADYSRQKFYKYYDIYIKAENKTSEALLKEVYSAVEKFFRGGTNE